MKKEEMLNLVKKITLLTKEDKIEWSRLKNNIDIYNRENYILREYIKNNSDYEYEKDKKNITLKDIDLFNSFFTCINSGKIFLFRKLIKNVEKYVLAVQSGVDSPIMELNVNMDFQQELLVLRYLITDKLDCTDKFIEGILNM